MRIIRYQTASQPATFGWVKDDKIGKIEGSPFSQFSRAEADILLEDVDLLPPVVPGKIICVGRNYAAHAAEHDAEVPEIPLIFLKPPSTVIPARRHNSPASSITASRARRRTGCGDR